MRDREDIAMQETGQTWKPTAAGIICVIAGVINIGSGIVNLVWGTRGGLVGLIWFEPALAIVIAIIAVVGGIHALKRNNWGLALAGSICALYGPWLILGILAIILVSLGKDEFQ